MHVIVLFASISYLNRELLAGLASKEYLKWREVACLSVRF